ncbi:MAG: efflux transporter outer membrane subunit [Verrucomicrobia bacterium]|nr:efflux transporter outer membrane subunit [Verrucomicrobiota bacterium]
MNKNVLLLLFLVLIGIAILATGCTMAPKYARPAAPIPTAWPTGTAYEVGVSTNAPQAVDVKWQNYFTDSKLQKVIGLALTNNRNLRVAALNVEYTLAIYGIRRAELLPTLSAFASGSRQRVPADLSSSGNRQISSRYDANLGVASWEIDFFGRIRSLKDRALEEYMASEQARRSTQLLLVASVSQTYLTMAADKESLKLAETTLEAQQGTYNLVKKRRELGLAPELDLFRAQTQVDTARGDVARFTQLIAQDKNTLDLLVGSPTPPELLPGQLATVKPPKEISAGVSSEVLLSRPDVLQSEDQLKAAYADIGAARAAFFPRISLTTAFGTASSQLSGLFKAGSGAWSYAPEIVMPIFDARTWSALKATKVQREIAVTQYEKAIQNAFKETADVLAVRGTVDDQIASQQSLVHANAETYRLSNFRYTMGIDSYLSVLDAQRSLYSAQQGLVTLNLTKLSNDVRLYAVLGGGWDADKPSIPVAAKTAPEEPKKN